jgi:hypothetical protein
MAAQPGEENVATLFGDIHYFYAPPEKRPRHHRFDKGSYVYLFENANDRRCRIEIANQPGAEDQDAFDGFLDQAHVRYSYKQHCAVSLTVPQTASQNEWHLPTYDPRNEAKYHYKLHSLDIYFWTQKDALQFVNGVRRVLPQNQVEVLDEPSPPAPQQHHPAMNSVVQNLENVAISDPQYGAPAPTGSRQGQQASASGSTEPGAMGMPPPPPPPQPANFAPMAYNPAAPAAPETVRHREKTPPPDEDPLNPLAVAVAYDYHKQPFTPGIPPTPQFPPGGITSPGLPPHGLASPGLPPQQGLQRSQTTPMHSGLASPGFTSPFGGGLPGMPPPPPQQQSQQQSQQHIQHQHIQQQPQQQPTPPLASPGLPGPGASGYQNYPYGQHQQQQPAGSMDYSIHQQVYRPMSHETSATGTPQPYQAKQEPRGRLEENAGRLERGVSGMFKKFEKKFG